MLYMCVCVFANKFPLKHLWHGQEVYTHRWKIDIVDIWELFWFIEEENISWGQYRFEIGRKVEIVRKIFAPVYRIDWTTAIEDFINEIHGLNFSPNILTQSERCEHWNIPKMLRIYRLKLLISINFNVTPLLLPQKIVSTQLKTFLTKTCQKTTHSEIGNRVNQHWGFTGSEIMHNKNWPHENGTKD